MFRSSALSELRRPRVLALLLIPIVVGGCVFGGKNSTSPRGGAAVTYQYVPVDDLDPQSVSDGQGIAGQNLLEGLVTPDAAGTGVVPATSDSWTVSHDRTVYTFHIRSGVKWLDGTPVTAQDFEWTYRRLLTPSTRTRDALNGSNAYETDLGIKNAEGYQQGRVTKWSQVSIKALGDSHLRIVLQGPNPAFLQTMAEPAMVALSPSRT